MSVRPLDDVWEVRGLPAICDPGQVTAELRAVSPSERRQAAQDDGGKISRVAIIREQRSVAKQGLHAARGQSRRRVSRQVLKANHACMYHCITIHFDTCAIFGLGSLLFVVFFLGLCNSASCICSASPSCDLP